MTITKGAKGVDFAYGWTAGLGAKLKAAGIEVVSGYLSWLPNGKVITAAMVEDYHAAGLGILLNWEYDGGPEVLAGTASGTRAATESVRQAKALGAPAGTAIVFSWDQDPTTHPTAANPFARAFAAVVKAAGYLPGAYGGYDAIQALAGIPGPEVGGGVLETYWQTYAWSDGKVSDFAQLYQLENGATVADITCDLDEVLKPVPGLWMPASDPVPVAKPAPTEAELATQLTAQDVAVEPLTTELGAVATAAKTSANATTQARITSLVAAFEAHLTELRDIAASA